MFHQTDSGFFIRVNAITLMIAVIVLGNSENRNEQRRVELIFDLMDFNKNGKISVDEMVSKAQNFFIHQVFQFSLTVDIVVVR